MSLHYWKASRRARLKHQAGPGRFCGAAQEGGRLEHRAPFAGSNYYYSSAGDRLNNFMYKPFTLAAGSTLTAKVKYNIELDWDNAYLVYSTDNGATWTGLQTDRSTTTNPNGQNYGYGITGSSGGNWVDLTASLPAGNVLLGFRYWTDTNTGGFGFMVDDINITGFPTDGAETDAAKVFDDRVLHYDATNPQGSVIHPNTGTLIVIQSISALGNLMQIQVRPVK